ncbi:MAG: hypothetical protein GX034_02580 [Clostridiaceae bacterium]|nr:hypothetical protein [Clostridiaceae bacterium]
MRKQSNLNTGTAREGQTWLESVSGDPGLPFTLGAAVQETAGGMPLNFMSGGSE